MTLFQRIGRAGQGIAAGWDEGDVERVWQGLRRKRRRHAAAAGAGLLSAVGLVVGAAFVFAPAGGLRQAGFGIVRRLGPDVETPSAAGRPREEAKALSIEKAPAAEETRPLAPSPGRPVRLTDGSTIAPWGAGAEPGALTIVEDGPQRVLVALARGGARFDVVPRPGRVFSIRAGEVTISVLGTAFSVERVADRVGVVVTRGAVLVDWRVGSRRLGAGQDASEGWFPPLVVASRGDGAHATAASNERRRVRHAPGRSGGRGAAGNVAREMARNEAQSSHDEISAPVSPSVVAAPAGSVMPERRAAGDGTDAGRPVEGPPIAARLETARESHAESSAEASAAGDHEKAHEPARVEASAGSLLADADRARLEGRAEEGASLLRRLVREYPADQRAPLAAFSLGRLLLGELGRPAQAARAFARARALAPEGPLAEDALAREAEAWARAKDLERARTRAAEYARRYPRGRRSADVKDAIDTAGASSSP